MIVLKDLIVCDDEYFDLATKYQELGETFDRQYRCFVKTLKNISEYAITSGQTHDNIEGLLTSLDGLKQKLSYSTDLASQLCGDFVDNIDEADSKLF